MPELPKEDLMAVSSFKPVSVAQIGARRHYAVPDALTAGDCLGKFYTDLWAGAFPFSLLANMPRGLLPAGLRRIRARRSVGIPNSRVIAFPEFGLRRVFERNRAVDGLRHLYIRNNRRFCELVVRSGLEGCESIYVFNGAGLEILRAAKSRGIATVLDQTSSPASIERRIMNEEFARWEGWENRESQEGMDPFIEREREEWSLADRVICGSHFVESGLSSEGIAQSGIRVVPYGVNQVGIPSRPRCGRRAVRLLFVGGVRLQKGVQYLFETAKLLASKSVEWRMVGPNRLNSSARKILSGELDLVGSIPRSEMDAEYRTADIFVFPSLCEGSANVCYEALAAGLPIVTTPNAGSIVEDGVEGFVVGPRDAEAMAEKIDLLVRDERLRAEMGAAAREKASRFSWDRYRSALLEALVDGKP